jgi:hypothetical protein
MLSIKPNGDGNPDLEVVDGLVQMVDGAEEIRQHLEIRLRLWRGEVFFNVDEGVDYADLVFPAEDPNDVLGELRRVALGTPGVLDAALTIASLTPNKIEVTGSYTASVEAERNLIREELAPITIGG